MGKSNPMKRGAHYHLARRDYSTQMGPFAWVVPLIR